MSIKHELKKPIKFILSRSNLRMRAIPAGCGGALDAVYASHMYGLSLDELAEISRTDEEEYSDMIEEVRIINENFDSCFPDRKGTELYILGYDGKLIKPSERIQKWWAGEPLIPEHPETVLDTWLLVDQAEAACREAFDRKKFTRYLSNVSDIFERELNRG